VAGRRPSAMADRLGLITDARARMRNAGRQGLGQGQVPCAGWGFASKAGLGRAESAARGRRPFEDARCGGDTRPTVVAVLYWRGGRFAGGPEVKLNALAILHISYNVCEQCIQALVVVAPLSLPLPRRRRRRRARGPGGSRGKARILYSTRRANHSAEKWGCTCTCGMVVGRQRRG
jgi:hypothetical protein